MRYRALLWASAVGAAAGAAYYFGKRASAAVPGTASSVPGTASSVPGTASAPPSGASLLPPSSASTEEGLLPTEGVSPDVLANLFASAARMPPTPAPSPSAWYESEDGGLATTATGSANVRQLLSGYTSPAALRQPIDGGYLITAYARQITDTDKTALEIASYAKAQGGQVFFWKSDVDGFAQGRAADPIRFYLVTSAPSWRSKSIVLAGAKEPSSYADDQVRLA